MGTQKLNVDAKKAVEFVEPDSVVAKSTLFATWGTTFETNDGLAVALQCQARGWKTLALELWEASLSRDTGHPYGLFYQPADLPPRLLIWLGPTRATSWSRPAPTATRSPGR